MKYFAYGSNMLQSRLAYRIKRFKLLGPAYLKGYRFTYNYPITNDFGTANIICTSNPDDIVWGVLYDVGWFAMHKLDMFEGVRGGVYTRCVEEVNWRYKTIKANLYIGMKLHFDQTEEVRPLAWYANHVALGAEQCGLPADYVRMLASQPSIQDKNVARAIAESRFWKG